MSLIMVGRKLYSSVSGGPSTTSAGQVACSIGPILAAATSVNERARKQKLLVALSRSARGECLYAAGGECIALQRRTQSLKY